MLGRSPAGDLIFGLRSGSASLFGDLASGGYTVGSIAAAFLVGYLWEHGWDRRGRIILAMLAGNAVLYIPGLLRLAVFEPNDKVFEYGH